MSQDICSLMTRFSIASRVFITRIYFVPRYISQNGKTVAHMGRIYLSYVIQHLKVGCTVHRSYFLASPGGSCCPIFVSAYENPRARARTRACSHIWTRAKTCHWQAEQAEHFPRGWRPTWKRPHGLTISKIVTICYDCYLSL